MPRLYFNPEQKLAARELRGRMTDAERCLWARVRRKQLDGVQFYRQRPIAIYVVDFYAPAARLVVEIDGSQHYDAKARLYDRDRTAMLASRGLRVLRFDNRQVLLETSAVLDEILSTIRNLNPP